MKTKRIAKRGCITMTLNRDENEFFAFVHAMRSGKGGTKMLIACVQDLEKEGRVGVVINGREMRTLYRILKKHYDD